MEMLSTMSEQHRSPLEQVILEQQHRKNAARGEQRRLLKAAGKPQNNDRKPKGGGRDTWRNIDPTDWEDHDVPRTQRIMPRDEGDRRRALAQAAFKTADDASDGIAVRATVPAGEQGVVVEVSTGLCRVEIDGQTLLCHIRGNLRAQEIGFTNAIATGDEVVVRDDGAGGGVVEAVLPRRSILARPDVFSAHLRQIIVANADQVLIVASWRDP